MTTSQNSPTWRQIRAFVRIGKKLGLGAQPGVDECFHPVLKAAHKAKATKEINTWQKAPANPESMRDAIARWFAVGEALSSIGVGETGETGIKPALDYYTWCKNRGDVSPRAKTIRFVEKAGLAAHFAPVPVPVPVPVQQAVVAFSASPPQPPPFGQSTVDKALILSRGGWTKEEIKALLGLD